MISFDSQLAALIADWQERGASTDSLLRDLVFQIATLGPAEKSVPEIVQDILASCGDGEPA